MKHSLEAITREHAAAHFPEAFEEGSVWKISKLHAREDAQVARCVLKIVGPGVAYAFKHEKAPINKARFIKVFERQQSAFQNFSRVAGLALAEPVRVDGKRQCAIFRFIEGHNLRDHLTYFCPTRELKLQMVERAGAWLDHFHRSGFDEQRKFHPNWVKNRYLDIRNDVEAGRLKLPETLLLTACLDELEWLAPDLRGQDTISALPHRDFHGGNLIWDGTTLTGIDVGQGRAAPVGQDINKFLIDLVRRFCDADELAPGRLYPADVNEAFFSGYKLVGPDDPTVRLFALAEIVDTWMLILADKLKRSAAKQECLTQLRPIAKRVISSSAAKKPLRVMLTKRSVEAERKGEHAFLPVLRKAAKRRGFDLTVREDSAGARKLAQKAGAYTMFHMSEPLGKYSLCFRKSYAAPFWNLATTGARWNWPVARASFNPAPSKEADLFFDHWANRMHCIDGKTIRDDGFIYMPLQGKLLAHRSFQSASPAEMIHATLKHTDLPVRATLHPNETYSDAELDILKEISALSSRFSVVDLPMQEALARCSYVVTENSSAGFHAMFYRKPVVLFADIDFHHVCLRVRDEGAKAAFAKVASHRPDVTSYLQWFWGDHAINLEEANAGAQLAKRLKRLGF